MKTDEPVDDRIRFAFGEADAAWDRRAEEALRGTRRRHARGLLLRRGAVAGAVAAAVAAGVVLLAGGPLGDDAAPDPVTPPPSESSDPSFGVTVLEGRWRTEPLDEAALRQAMDSEGDGAYADDVVAQLPAAPFRLAWVVTRGIAQLRAETAAGEVTVLDEVAIVVEGESVTMSPRFAEGATVHRFAVADDELRLTFVSTTEKAKGGVPGAVWQRLLYDDAAFTRG